MPLPLIRLLPAVLPCISSFPCTPTYLFRYFGGHLFPQIPPSGGDASPSSSAAPGSRHLQYPSPASPTGRRYSGDSGLGSAVWEPQCSNRTFMSPRRFLFIPGSCVRLHSSWKGVGLGRLLERMSRNYSRECHTSPLMKILKLWPGRPRDFI